MKQKKEYIPLLAGVCTSIIFGFSFLFIKDALNTVSPFRLLGLRFALAAVALTLLQIFGVIKINLRSKKLFTLVLLALLQPVLYFSFETKGVSITTASESGMVIALTPIFATILGAVILKEIPTRLQWVFISMTVCGVILTVAMKDTQGTDGNIYGIYLLLLAVVAAGFYRILSRQLSLHYTSIEITYIMMWFGAICFNGISIFDHIKSNSLSNYFVPLQNFRALLSILYLGILSSIVAFFLNNYVISRLDTSRAAVLSNLTTIVSVFAGVVFRNEPFFWYHAVGVVMILVGVWGTNNFKRVDISTVPRVLSK